MSPHADMDKDEEKIQKNNGSDKQSGKKDTLKSGKQDTPRSDKKSLPTNEGSTKAAKQ